MTKKIIYPSRQRRSMLKNGKLLCFDGVIYIQSLLFNLPSYVAHFHYAMMMIVFGCLAVFCAKNGMTVSMTFNPIKVAQKMY